MGRRTVVGEPRRGLKGECRDRRLKGDGDLWRIWDGVLRRTGDGDRRLKGDRGLKGDRSRCLIGDRRIGDLDLRQIGDRDLRRFGDLDLRRNGECLRYRVGEGDLRRERDTDLRLRLGGDTDTDRRGEYLWRGVIDRFTGEGRALSEDMERPLCSGLDLLLDLRLSPE